MSKVVKKITIEVAYESIISKLANKTHNVPKTKNKGGVGHFIEETIGLQKNSDCLDCLDGEIKAFPIRLTKKDKKIVPKETIAITMINRDDLKITKYKDSKLRDKINKVVFVPYLRTDDDNVTIYKPIFINLSENKELDKLIEADYNKIQKKLVDDNRLESKIGDLIQARTKGSKDSDSRAFYFKTKYAKDYLIESLSKSAIIKP
jgi:DNA mismatch repair protein MutH